jgi:hypothetical protein
MTRFGIYETVKQQIDKPGVPMPFYQKVLLGGFAGCIGGFVGTPADLINVRLVFTVEIFVTGALGCAVVPFYIYTI